MPETAEERLALADATVEGVKGEWRVDPTYLDDAFDGRTALLSPRHSPRYLKEGPLSTLMALARYL